MFAALLLCLLPQQAPDDLDLEPVKVSLHAEPGTARTEALLELLRTRFLEVELNADWADVWVVDSAAAVGAGEHYFECWKPYARAGEVAPSGPRVFLGAAVPRAIEFLGLVGHEAAVARAETVGWRGHPATPRGSADLDGEALLGAHTPLAFALKQAPDVEIVWHARDDRDRPVAAVWQQDRYLFFAPTAGPAQLGADGCAALLDVVLFASGFSHYDGSPLSMGAPGENASAELSWWLSREDVDLARCRALLGEELAAVATDVASVRSWHADRGFSLLADTMGRLRVDPDLEAFGKPPSDGGFVERVLARLDAATLDERDLARRLLSRHVADGPGAYASVAEWSEWFSDAGEFLVFCHADARWRLDHGARANRSSAGSWPPSQRANGRIALEEAPLGASPEELVDWLVSGGHGRRGSIGWLAPTLARIVAGPLATAWETAVDARERAVLEHWIGKLGVAVALIEERMHSRVERDPASSWFELRAIVAGRPKDAVPLLQSLVQVAHARQSVEVGERGWSDWISLTNYAPLIAGAIETSSDPGGAAKCAVDMAIEEAVAPRSLAADVLTSAAAECEALRREDLVRLLDVLATKASLEAETVAPGTLAKLVQASGDPRWIGVLDALLERDQQSGRSIVADVAPAYLKLGPIGIARFEHVIGGEVMAHADLLSALAQSDKIDDSWLEKCLQDESRRALAYAVLGQSPARWDRWSGRLRQAALGVDPDEAVLAVASLGNLAEQLREAVPPLAEALGHDSPWVRRGAAFELGSPYRDVRAAEAALVRGLDDPDPWVQKLAAWALREPRGVGEDAATARLRELASGDGVLANVARDALRRRNPDPAWLIRELRGVRPHQGLDTGLSLASATPRSRWNAARNLALSEEGAALLDRLLDDDAAVKSAADERIRRIDHELRSWLADRCAVLDEEIWGGPASDELSGLGPVGIAHLEHELMRPYRFPIGLAIYMELVLCLGRIGAPAWPVLAASHWHWIGQGLTDTAPAWESVARDSGGALAPFLAMRLARDSALRCSFDWYADSRNEEDLQQYLRPMWDALGAEGEAALDELATHPLADVRAAVSRVRP
ncbi:MAG: hypothetical protein GC161_00655 [Planctomycetaceae bacterium]|nr:hypothetical protein [Planctomycetaceae bacterium]